MPLILIGLIFLIGLLIYAVLRYIRSDGGSGGGRPHEDKRDREEDKVLLFPGEEDIEREKRRRHIGK
jgi:hypothetical protein